MVGLSYQLVVQLLRHVKIRHPETIKRVFEIDYADAGSRAQDAHSSSHPEVTTLGFPAARQVIDYQLISFQFLSQKNRLTFTSMDSGVNQIKVRLPRRLHCLEPLGRPQNPCSNDAGRALSAQLFAYYGGDYDPRIERGQDFNFSDQNQIV
jgi:hypothetical protein